MTAPQPATPGSDSARAQITEALRDVAHRCIRFPCVSCQIVSDEDFASTIWATTVHEHQVIEVQANVTSIADVLVPLVDRLRAEAKAEALEEARRHACCAADEHRLRVRRDRAATLREATP